MRTINITLDEVDFKTVERIKMLAARKLLNKKKCSWEKAVMMAFEALKGKVR